LAAKVEHVSCSSEGVLVEQRSRRVVGAALLIAVALLLVCRTGTARELSPGFAKAECEEFVWAPERFDYRSERPADQTRIRQIESNHLDRDTENLVKAKTGYLGGDIDFVLRYIPNHPRALAAFSRLALRDNMPRPSGASISVECHFLRALTFVPDDAAVLAIYGTFLARVNRPKEALARMQEAEKLDPENALLLYNIGLVQVALGDYQSARYYAERAYAKGATLPGLRDRLQKQGVWKQ